MQCYTKCYVLTNSSVKKKSVVLFSTSKVPVNSSVVSVFINLHCADCVCLYSMDLVSVTKP